MTLKIKLLLIMIMIFILLLINLTCKKLWYCVKKTDNFVRKTDFKDKLQNVNKNITSDKTKHLLVETELNELSEKAKAIPTTWLRIW